MSDNSHFFPLAPHLRHGSAPARLHGWQSQAQRDAEAKIAMAAEREARLAAKAARAAALAAEAGHSAPDSAPEVLPLDGGGACPVPDAGLGGGDGAGSTALAGEITPPLNPPHQGEGDSPASDPQDPPCEAQPHGEVAHGALAPGDGGVSPLPAGEADYPSVADRSATGATSQSLRDREDLLPDPASPEPVTREALPAATSAAADEIDDGASLAPLPSTGGAGGGPVRALPDSEEAAAAEEDEDDLSGWTPPPRKRKPRHAEWTRQKMALFLRELAASQSVSQAARSVGMSRVSAYRLRARLVGTPFAFGWEVALEAGLAQLAHAMLDRAVNGVEVPHYYKGEVVGTSRHYDERLAIWLMGNPWKVGRQQMAREYSAEGFDRLLERIETGPLDWGAQYDGGCDQLPGLLPPARSAARAEERQNAFMDGRSWYGGGAGESAPSARGGRR